MVQNKFHYVAHGHTAPEIIYERADEEYANKKFNLCEIRDGVQKSIEKYPLYAIGIVIIKRKKEIIAEIKMSS